MAIPRAQIVDPNEPGLYHCYSRCVRRAFLMGPEHDHRRAWIERRLELLCSIFAVDDAAHSAMSNHLHVLVRPRSVYAHAGAPLKRGDLPPPEMPDEVIGAVAQRPRLVEEYRRRLGSLSWFMKSLKEPLARMANAEDGVTGVFWEARFKSPRILDLVGLITCMVYIDLNPIHAGIAESLDESMFTSVRLRLEALRRFVKSRALRMTLPETDVAELERMLDEEATDTADSTWMAPIGGEGTGEREPLLHMEPADYIAIVETAGRTPDQSKRGMIPSHVQSVLESLCIDVERWLKTVTKPAGFVGTAIGSAASLALEAARRGVRRIVGALNVCVIR
jgi:hypothetical protein